MPGLPRARKLVLARPAAVLLGLSGIGLAALAGEAVLGFGGYLYARAANPRPYLLTHLLALGTLLDGLAALAGAHRLLRWARGGCFPRWPLGLLGLGLAGLVGYVFYVEPRWLDTPEVEIHPADLPPAFDGLRIVLISDLHVGPHVAAGEVERVVAASNALRPDLVALLGDFVASDPAGAAVVADAIPRFAAPLGVYAVLGNHDFWVDPEAIARPLRAAGVRVLRNQGLALEHNGAGLWLAGVDDPRFGHPDFAAALAGARPDEPRILLAHNPMLVRAAEQRGVPLVLAGHTHGGQVQLPGLGPLLLPIPDRSLTEGLLRRGRTQLYVTRGVGVGTPPARLGARPEVTVVVLRSRSSAPASRP